MKRDRVVLTLGILLGVALGVLEARNNARIMRGEDRR